MDALEHGMTALKPRPSVDSIEAAVKHFLAKKYKIKEEDLIVEGRSYSTGNFPFDNYLPGLYIIAKEPRKNDIFYFSKQGMFIGHVYRGTAKNEWIGDEYDRDGNLKFREKFIRKGDRKKTISKERVGKKEKMLHRSFSGADTCGFSSYANPQHYVWRPQKIC